MQAWGPGLWYAAADVRFYGAAIQTRMSVVRLPDDGLAVISPLVLDPSLIRDLASLGEVRHVLSPNKIHNQGLESCARAWPEARIWASPGLAERRPELEFAGTLDDTPHPDWAGVMDQLCTKGNLFFSEVVFFHRPSRTLIVADLVENISAATLKGGAARAAAKLGHIFGRTLPSPEFRLYTSDAAAAAARLDEMLRWPFERILLAHGDLITEDAHGALGQVRDFLVSEVESRPGYRRRLYRFMAARQ